ncbi:MAG: SufS family cysteine desulfurase [Candidatus Micrarchaeota archaeon]|nr:SufS family cysteine desulfurase [Candidatus Micrarchaeota archaeon]
MMVDYKKDFPILERFHYLDSAATSLKPIQVIEAEMEYYKEYPANVHRGVYKLSERATEMFERTRDSTARMFGAKSREVIFTRNTTESLNLLAATLGNSVLRKGDTVLLTAMEHHSNIVPWLMLKERVGIRVEFVELEGQSLDYEDFKAKVGKYNPKVVSFMHASNVLGTINDAAKIIKLAKRSGAITIMDCAQSAPHIKVDFSRLGVDYIAFSAHKLLGPTGVGVLIGKESQLEELPPFMGGGSMIREVSRQGFKPAELPQKFEAGTPNIAGVIGFGAALDYIKKVGFGKIESVEKGLLAYILKRARELGYIKVYSSQDVGNAVGIFAFNVDGVHPHDVSALLDEANVCIRAGHHCAQPLHSQLGINYTARASLYFYNTKEDVDALFCGLENVKKVFNA